MSGRNCDLPHSSHLTVITRQAFYIYLAGKKTAVKFAGLAGCCACYKKCIQLVAHEAAERHVFGRYIYNRKKRTVFCQGKRM